MPAIVGAVQIISISTSSIFHVGDVFTIAPTANVKTFAGAGSFNTGEKLQIYNHVSSTNTYDQDSVDQAMLFNA